MAEDEKARKRAERDAKRDAKKAKKEKEKAKKEASGESGGIVQRAKDTYNGLFKIVIQPQLPSLRVLGFMVVAFTFGLLFGYLYAYQLNPTEYYDANPNALSPQQRDQYVILVAGARQANLYDDENTIQLLSRVEDPAETVQGLIERTEGSIQNALQSVVPLAQQAAPGTPAPDSGGTLGTILGIVLITIFFIILFVILANIFATIWGLLIGGYVERFLNSLKPETEADRKAHAAIVEIRRRKELEEQMKTEAAASPASEYGAPVMQRISTYTKGRPYDDSFAIEDTDDMFLGECGATIAKTIGDTQELTAIEIWLFDKEDFIRTLTKIFATEHAYNDPAIRAELDTKVENPETDIILLKEGAEIFLDTDQILVKAKVVDTTPGTVESLPPNSHFEALTLQMSGFDKAGAGGGSASAAPAAAAEAASGLPDLSSYEIGPPPDMPSGGQTQPSTPQAQEVDYNPAPPPPQPQSGGLPDLSSYEIGPPPPMPGEAQGGDDDDEEDDIFGGTGDFTPLGR
jgi:hypothetical protein